MARLPLFTTLALLGLSSAPASALTVTGWFEGTVTFADSGVNQNPVHGPDFFFGAPATGSLRIDIPDAQAASQPLDELNPLLDGRTTLSIRVRGVDFVYEAGGGQEFSGLWQVAADGGYAGFWSDYRPRFEGYILHIGSEDNAMLPGPTAASLRLEGATTFEDVYFASWSESGSFGIDVTRFGFQTLAAPVPEPSLAVLMGLGCVGVAVARRRKA